MNNESILNPNFILDHIKQDLELKPALEVKHDLATEQGLDAKQDLSVEHAPEEKKIQKLSIQQPDPTDDNWEDIIKNITISPDNDYAQSVYGIGRLEKNDQIHKIVITEGLTVIAAKPKMAKTKMALLFISIALK